jgi:hypothetical protein
LHVAFQSPLAHPDNRVGELARHVRLWTLESETGALLAEYLYPLDEPTSFRRDSERGDVERADVKLCDMAVVEDSLVLVLERISTTAKIYLVALDPEHALAAVWSEAATRPTIEELSGEGTLALPVLEKHLLLSTDDHPEIGADLGGLTILDRNTILLVNDNDFGIEGVPTRFWRVQLPEPLGWA